MSLSGSSASRKSIWAITRFARSSSMKVGRKMIRSFNRREKMSNARSPRGVCSITIGTRAIGISLSSARPNPGVVDEHLEGPAVAQSAPQRLEVTVLLHHTPDCRHGAAARLGDLLQLGVHVGVGGLDRLALGHRLQQQRPPDGLLRPWPDLGAPPPLLPRHPVRVEPLLAHALPRVL